MHQRWLQRVSWPILGLALALACGSGNDENTIVGPGQAGGGGAAGAAMGGDENAAGQISDDGRAGSAGASGGVSAEAGESGTGSSSGGDAGGGGIGGPLGDGGQAGSGTPQLPINGLYVAIDGSDSDAGTLEAPFLTLAHAASVAQAGDTIVLMDGKHVIAGASNTSIPLADGVSLMALNAGQTTVAAQGEANLVELGGTHDIRGLAFENFQHTLRFAAGVAAGKLAISGSTFKGCVKTCIEASGAAVVSVHAEEGAALGNGSGKFLVATGSSQVRVAGGVLRNFGSNAATFDAAIEVRNDAAADVTNLLVDDGVALAFSAREQATLNAKNVVVTTLGRTVLGLADDANVTFLDSDLSLKVTSAVKGPCINQTLDNRGSIRLEHTKLHGCESGLYGSIPKLLAIIDSELYDHKAFGMDGDGSGGKITITGSRFYAIGQVGLRLGPSTSNIELSIRDTEIAAPDTTSVVGAGALQLAASPSSTLDLGTVAAPGGNRITGQNAASPGIRLHSTNGGLVTAVGNTWVANQQGADGAGHYAAVAGTTFEVVGPALAGVNYGVSFPSAVLRLAETAP